MRLFSHFSTGSALTLALLLAACAGDVAKPVALQPLDISRKADLRIADITGEAKPGVNMSTDIVNRIVEMARAEIASKYPAALAAPGPGSTPAHLKLVFTSYDEGNAFARFMLAGLGQIKIEAVVSIVGLEGDKVLGQYQVAKQFAFGGVYGGTTNIRDVEIGFARSVAEVLSDKL